MASPGTYPDLFAAPTLDAAIARINRLTPDSQPVWGRMTVGQMLAHHASNGCAMRPGDLLGSGTVSGRARDTRGCLLELTWRGAEPLALSNGETRAFLEDGDEVVMTAYAERDGVVRIGLGCCRGRIEPTRG